MEEMYSFERKGTVSKPSRPTHVYSYALKGIPIKYMPEIFVPDLLRLPAHWSMPSVPSEDLFRYDYSRERHILEQARIRTLSVVAEAEASEQHQTDTTDSSPLLPILPTLSSTILTPTPVTTTMADGNTAVSTTESSGSVNAIVSLGQLSLMEFEGDNSDPFEMATLQAINDFEVLQSVLQPTVCTTAPVTATSSPSPIPTFVTPPVMTAVAQSLQVLPPAAQVQTLSQITPNGITSTASTPPVQPQAVAMVTVPLGSPATNPFLSSAPLAMSTTVPQSTQVLPSATVGGVLPPIQDNQFARLFNTSPHQNTATTTTTTEPGVGTLIEIGPATSRTSPIQELPPPYSSVSTTTPTVPIPIPRQRNLPNSPLSFTPQQPSPHAGPPPVPPKPHLSGQATATGTTVTPTSGNPLPLPPKGVKVGGVASSPTVPSVQSRLNALLANPPPVRNRPGLGVPVLPPITQPGDASPEPTPARRHTPPPPYFTEQETERARLRPPPVPTPRVYTLPDPQSNLSSEEKVEVKSISGMGFPAPRVARAVQRLDKSKVLDFLFLIGKLEDLGYSGDSAETALLANKQDSDKAVYYLKKLEGYKEIGFPEKAIHEAFERASGDWDQALDILTQGGR